MEERKLNFVRSDDQTIVSFSDSELAGIKKGLENYFLLLQTFHDEVKNKTLTVSYKETISGLLEGYARDLTSLLGYEGQLKREAEARFSEIKSLNNENRELRKQLGNKVSYEDVREGLKNMNDSFNYWWNVYGFGHVRDSSFTPYGFKAFLSGNVTDAYYNKDDFQSQEEKAIYLRNLGFEIGEDEEVFYNDKNIQLLEKLLKSKYPSCEIRKSSAFRYSKNHTAPEIWEVEIFIKNFNELV